VAGNRYVQTPYLSPGFGDFYVEEWKKVEIKENAHLFTDESAEKRR